MRTPCTSRCQNSFLPLEKHSSPPPIPLRCIPFITSELEGCNSILYGISSKVFHELRISDTHACDHNILNSNSFSSLAKTLCYRIPFLSQWPSPPHSHLRSHRVTGPSPQPTLSPGALSTNTFPDSIDFDKFKKFLKLTFLELLWCPVLPRAARAFVLFVVLDKTTPPN